MPSRLSLRDAYQKVVSRLAGARPVADEQPPEPEPEIPRPRKPTVGERTAQFATDLRVLNAGQLEALIEAWNGLDQQARDEAWHDARPVLTAADRKDLLTNLGEQIKLWTAAGSGDGTSETSAVRRRAGRALLDAAAGVIVQDRVAKRHFEVLYSPFRAALTGQPIPHGAPGTIRHRRRATPEELHRHAVAASVAATKGAPRGAAKSPATATSVAAAAAAKTIAGTASIPPAGSHDLPASLGLPVGQPQPEPATGSGSAAPEP